MKKYIVYEIGNGRKYFAYDLGTDRFTAEVIFSHIVTDWNNGYHSTVLVLEEEE